MQVSRRRHSNLRCCCRDDTVCESPNLSHQVYQDCGAVSCRGRRRHVARLIGQKLSESFKQTVIIDNIGGASGALGHEAAARAEPDGYTFILATGSTIATNPLVAKVTFDPIKDFTPVAMIALDPLALIVHPSVPVKNVQELIQEAKANPGKLNMASFGNGSISHLAGEMFNAMAGTKMVHVPYRGAAPAMNDIIAGHVSVMFNTMGVVDANARAGKVRLLAVGSSKRVASLPDVPTVAEAGIPGFEAATWHGLFGPAKLPAEVVNRISSEVAAILKQPDVRERLATLGYEPTSGSQEELRQRLVSDIERWSKIVKDVGITAN